MSVDIHALSGAYAVDAVDEFERAQFERHLADCETCRAEVRSLRSAAVLIAETSAQQPPASLRESVLASVQSVRPLPPVVIAAAERGRSTRRRFPALVAAAAALIAVGGLGATAWHESRDDDTPVAVAQPSLAERVLQDPEAERYAATLQDGVTLEVVHSPARQRAVLRTEGLPELPASQVYQLWLDIGGDMVPAGFLDDPAMPAVLHGEVEVATSANITVEKAEGAKHPDLENFVGAVELA